MFLRCKYISSKVQVLEFKDQPKTIKRRSLSGMISQRLPCEEEPSLIRGASPASTVRLPRVAQLFCLEDEVTGPSWSGDWFSPDPEFAAALNLDPVASRTLGSKVLFLPNYQLLCYSSTEPDMYRASGIYCMHCPLLALLLLTLPAPNPRNSH